MQNQNSLLFLLMESHLLDREHQGKMRRNQTLVCKHMHLQQIGVHVVYTVGF